MTHAAYEALVALVDPIWCVSLVSGVLVGLVLGGIHGYALAKKGQAGRALGAGYTAALLGGALGALLLDAVIPIIGPFVLHIGLPKLLSFSFFGLATVSVLSGRVPLKGLVGARICILLAKVGSASPTRTERWTFQALYLWDHLPLLPITLGLFAMPEPAETAITRISTALVVPPNLIFHLLLNGRTHATLGY